MIIPMGGYISTKTFCILPLMNLATSDYDKIQASESTFTFSSVISFSLRLEAITGVAGYHIAKESIVQE